MSTSDDRMTLWLLKQQAARRELARSQCDQALPAIRLKQMIDKLEARVQRGEPLEDE